MSSTILYLQPNRDIAGQFRDRFLTTEFDFIVANSGKEAIDTISETNVTLMLVDINIPDMRMRELVERTNIISPQTILNVCIDINDPLTISKLVNRYRIHKIYVAPWDVDEIIDEMKDSVEVAIINGDTNIKESQLSQEVQDFKKKLEEMKAALLRQRYTFKELSMFYNGIFNGIISGNEVNEDTYFLKETYNEMIKRQTTGSFDIEKFEDSIKQDIAGLKKKYNSISEGDVISCLFGGTNKSEGETIRFVIWLIARMFSEIYEEFEYSSVSALLSTVKIELVCKAVSLKNSGKYAENMEKYKNRIEFVKTLVSALVEEAEFFDSEEESRYSFKCKIGTR